MVVIRKNWQALPVSTTTVTAPVSSYTPPPDPIQQPTTHLSSKPDIVELNKINHNKPNEPMASTYIYSNDPPLVQPKKRSWIIEQQGLLDQFSFSNTSGMDGGNGATLNTNVFCSYSCGGGGGMNSNGGGASGTSGSGLMSFFDGGALVEWGIGNQSGYGGLNAGSWAAPILLSTGAYASSGTLGAGGGALGGAYLKTGGFNEWFIKCNSIL